MTILVKLRVMKNFWKTGYEIGVDLAKKNPQIIYGYPSIPTIKGSVKNRNLFSYGFVHGFRSVANKRLTA